MLPAQAKTITHTYKANDLPVASIQYWNRGSVSYTTNGLGQLTGLTDWSGNTSQYAYRATGQLASASVNGGNAFVAAYAYDTAGRTSRIQRTKGGSNVLDLQYAPSGLPGRDPNGNLRSLRELWLGEAALDTQYLYDALDRLIEADHDALPGGAWGGGAQGARLYDYVHDAAGNLTTMSTTQTFSYDAADRISSPGFSYDANGNMSAAPKRGLNWEAEGTPNEAVGQANLTWSGTAAYAPSPAGQGQAFVLDGVNFLSTPSTPAMMPQTELTVGATFRLDTNLAGSPSWPGIVGIDSWTAGESSFSIGVQPVTRKAYCDIYLAGNTSSNQPSSRLWTDQLTLGETYRLETTYNPNTGEHKCLLNGSVMGRRLIANPEPIRVVSATPLRIGRDRGNSKFVGLIDDVVIAGADVSSAPFGPTLYNGTFLLAPFDSGWSFHNGWGTRTAPSGTYIAHVDHEAAPPDGVAGKFLRITWPAGDGSTGHGPGVAQRLLGDFVVNRQYRLKLWARSVDGGQLQMQVKQQALAGFPTIWYTNVNVPTSWTYHEYTVSTSDPSYTTETPYLRLVSNVAGKSVDVDGVVWEPVP